MRRSISAKRNLDVVMQFMQFEDSSFTVVTFMVHRYEFAPKYNFVVNIRGSLLNDCRIYVVKAPDENIKFYICIFHVFIGESQEGAVIVDWMHHSPVHGQVVYATSFEFQTVKLKHWFATILAQLKAYGHPDLHVCQCVVFFIGGETEHQRSLAPKRRNQRLIAECQIRLWFCKSSIDQAGCYSE